MNNLFKKYVFKFNNIIIIIELVLIFIYSCVILFSIVIMPINIILGVVCILFLPGYNLLNIIKPKYSPIEKLGYMTIVSLCIENFIMFFAYIFLYDIVTTPENPAFFFNNKLLIMTFQIINLFLIFIKRRNNYKFKRKGTGINKEESIFNIESLKKSFSFKTSLISIAYILSLTFLCISTYYSRAPEYEYKGLILNANEFFLERNFIFFERVPLIFYVFLTSSILCLTYLIFFAKNRYLVLSSISMFLYCLWILPYLHINYYFGDDSIALSEFCQIYFKYGIWAIEENSLAFMIHPGLFTFHGYSTGVFTGILLTIATNVDVNFALWYLYSLIFIPIPFFFYSVFQKYNLNNDKDHINSILLTIFAIISPLFIKYAHSATTIALGVYIFFILVVEFFAFINRRDISKSNKDLIITTILFCFLCLTRMEECIYFILIVCLYSYYYFFSELKKVENKEFNHIVQSELSIYNSQRAKRNNEKILFFKNLKNFLIRINFFVFSLFLIFYLTHEFLGYIVQYFYSLFPGGLYKENLLYILYENSKIEILSSLRIGFKISILFIIIIIIAPLVYYIICYLSLFKAYKYFSKIIDFVINKIKKLHIFLINNLISKKIFQILIFPLSFLGVLALNYLYTPFLQEEGYLLIIELIGSYFIFILNIFLFINGVKYYKIKYDKQNYFFIAIVASASIMMVLFFAGVFFLSFYILNSKFFTFFIFFNLIIIQNTYFKRFTNKKKIYLILLIIMLFFFGVFYSLRKLAYG